DFSLVRYKGDQAAADAVYAGVADPLTAGDIAETIVHAVELPPHVDLDLVIVKPVAQSAVRTIHTGALTPKG
ncbi:oxidoreductase, partial [Schumannella luteola]